MTLPQAAASTDAIAAGAGRFGAILWVKPRDVKRAAKVLGIGGEHAVFPVTVPKT